MLKARADWLVKPRTSRGIYLRAIREKMASRFASVTSEKIFQINFFVVYIISSRLGKYPPLATSTSVNSFNYMCSQLCFIFFEVAFSFTKRNRSLCTYNWFGLLFGPKSKYCQLAPAFTLMDSQPNLSLVQFKGAHSRHFGHVQNNLQIDSNLKIAR